MVDLTEQLVEAFDRGDVDAIEQLGADDAVVQAEGLGMRFEGAKAVRAFIEDWLGSFADLSFELRGVSRVSENVVLAVIEQRGRPVGAAGAVQQLEAWAIRWAGGQIARLSSHLDLEEARAAAQSLAEGTDQAMSTQNGKRRES